MQNIAVAVVISVAVCLLAPGSQARLTVSSYTSPMEDNVACEVTSALKVSCVGTAWTSPAPTGLFSGVTTSLTHACGMHNGSTSGECWGPQNVYGQLTLPPGGIYAQLLACNNWTCALGRDGVPVCRGIPGRHLTPPLGVRFTSLSCGDEFVCGVEFSGAVYCWGSGDYNVPAEAPESTELFSRAVSGTTHACAVRVNGSVVCWGERTGNKCAVPAALTTPVSQGGLRAVALACGESFCCATTQLPSTTPVCWGDQIPSPLPSIVNPISVVVGPSWICIFDSAGKPACQGSTPSSFASTDIYPQLCGDNIISATSPVPCDGGVGCLDDCECPVYWSEDTVYNLPGCYLSTCGNNVTDDGEQCDSGENCRDDCTCPPFYTPLYDGCTLCGNGRLDTGEQCDGTTNCTADCTCVSHYVGTVNGSCSLCGNKFVDPGEMCDSGPFCSSPGCQCPVNYVGVDLGCSLCGNGRLDAGEECDSAANCTGCKCNSGYTPVGNGSCYHFIDCTAFSNSGSCTGGGCRWCGSTCLPLQAGACPGCESAGDMNSCDALNCNWCGFGCAVSCPTCLEITNGTNCALAPGCKWCGSMHCVFAADCTQPPPIPTLHYTRAKCEIGTTDLKVIVTVDPGVTVKYTWVVRPLGFSDYLKPKYLGRVGMFNGPLVLATSVVAFDSWRLTMIPTAADGTPGIPVQVVFDSSTCILNCSERETPIKCVTHGCFWCGDAFSCRQNAGSCQGWIAGGIYTNSSYGGIGVPSNTFCADGTHATGIKFAWRLAYSGMGVKRLHRVAAPLTAAGFDGIVASQTSYIRFVMYSDSMFQFPDEILFSHTFAITHFTAGVFELNFRLFDFHVLVNQTVWLSIQWVTSCPGLYLRLPYLKHRAVNKETMLVEDPSNTAEEKGSLWLPLPTAYLPPLVELSQCGNGGLNPGEECDGGWYCTSNCTCPSGWEGDGAGGCTLNSSVTYQCKYYYASGSLTGTPIAIQNAPTVDVCENACCQTLGCSAYTFLATNKSCVIRSESGAAVPCPTGVSCTSGIVSQCPFQVSLGQRVTGTPNATLVVSSADDCAFACCAAGNCLAWTYYSSSCSLYAIPAFDQAPGYVSGFLPGCFSENSTCQKNTPFCAACDCIYGHVALPNGTCSCPLLDPQKFSSMPVLGAKLNTGGKASLVTLTVALPDTSPQRSSAYMSVNGLNVSLLSTGACLLTNTYDISIVDLIKSPSCVKGTGTSDYISVTCTVQVWWTEAVLFSNKLLDRFVSSALKFELRIARVVEATVLINATDSKTLWAYVRKSEITVDTSGIGHLTVSFATQSPVYSHIDNTSMIVKELQGLITSATISEIPPYGGSTQKWLVTMTLNVTTCTLGSGDGIKLAYDLVTNDVVPTVHHSQMSLTVGGTEQLCSVAEEAQFTAVSSTSDVAGLTPPVSFFFLDHEVYVGVSISLFGQFQSGIKASPVAVRFDGGYIGPMPQNVSYTVYTCTNPTYSLCYHFNLSSTFFEPLKPLTITTEARVDDLSLSKRSTRLKVPKGHLYTHSTVYLVSPPTTPTTTPTEPTPTTPTQPPAAYVTQVPTAMLVATVVVALLAGAGIALFAVVLRGYLARRQPPASA